MASTIRSFVGERVMARQLFNVTLAFFAWAIACLLAPPGPGIVTPLACAQDSVKSPATSHSLADRKQSPELIVNADGAQAREFPHIEAQVLATLSKGTTVYELRRVTNWVEVRGLKERLGWIEARGLSVGKDGEQQPGGKSSATVALTLAAIAALIVEESRQAYYAIGRSCACPEDLTPTGRRCGGNSAYSRPGGASPFCYPSDVPPERIEQYRRKLRQ
jgi:hypothetical protein